MRMKKLNLLKLLTAVLLAFTASAQSLEEGEKHLNAERYTTAGETFTSLASSNPTPENLLALGYYYLKIPNAKQNLDNAKAAFDKANASEKNGLTSAQIALGAVMLGKEDYAGAKSMFSEAMSKKRDQKNPDNYYRIAEAYTLFPWANDPGEAIINIDKALELKEEQDNPKYYLVKAAAYLIKNEGGETMNALQNAERIGYHDMAAIYSTMAKVWLQGKNYKEAQDAIAKSLAADPTHAPACKYQSSLEQTYQKFDKAAQAAQCYLDNSDGDCAAKLRYTKLAFIAKDYDNVLNTIEEIKDCNEDPIVNRLAGITKYEQGKSIEAVPLLDKYIKIAPKEEVFPLDYGFLGRSYFTLTDTTMMQQNRAKGVDLMEKAVALGDTTFDYYTFIADIYKEEKKYPEAITFYKKVISAKKNPTGSDFANLGLLQYQTRNWEEADSTFDKVLVAYKDTWPQAYLLSAQVKSYKNKPDTTFVSADRYQQYLNLLPDEAAMKADKRNVIPALNYLAGKELMVNKDVEKATEYIDKILAIDPDNQEYIQKRNEINGVIPEEEERPEGEMMEETTEE